MWYVPIGETFKRNGVELVPVADARCRSCYFFNHATEEKCDLGHISVAHRHCLGHDRPDGISVSYVRPDDYALARLKGEL